MNWLKVVRGTRSFIWTAAGGLALYTIADFERRMFAFDQSAMQQGARASVAIAELVALLLVALAFDRILELRERALIEKRSRVG